MAASIFTKSAKVFLAQQFKASVSNNNMYLTISRPTAWANDALPDNANSSVESINSFWRNMIGGVKITGSDVSYCIPRINWTQNTVYSAYSSSVSNIFDTQNNKFYVMTTDYNVYKCLFNGNNANSTIKPTSTNPNTIIQTLDGYYWKYMLTVPSSDRLRFMTDDYIPVRILTLNDNSLQWKSQTAAVDGSINIIRVTSGGSGYSNAANLVVTVTGDGTNLVAIANTNTTTNTVSSVTLTSYGSGYSYGTVTFSAGGGITATGATAVAEISPKGGHGYSPTQELGASNLMLNVKIKGSENGVLTTGNDFRQIGIILNPYQYGTTNAFTTTTFSQTMDISVSGTGSNFEPDETVYQGTSLNAATFYGKVVDFDSANNLARITGVYGTPTSDVLVGATTSATRFVTSINYQDVQPYSGQIFYINNVTPVIRNELQYENFKILLTF